MTLRKKLNMQIVTIICILLAVISFLGILDTSLDFIGGKVIKKKNITYLENSFDKSIKGFLVLSSIKSGLAIIEGSGVGVGFNLEIGDAVQPVYDYVDIAWKASLAGGTVLLMAKLLYNFVQHIDQYFLSLLFLLLALSIFMQKGKYLRISNAAFSFTNAIFTITILLYFALPLSISIASFMSQRITTPIITEAMDGFSSIKKDLSAEEISKKLNKKQEATKTMGLLQIPQKFYLTKQKVIEITQWIKDQSYNMAIWTVKLVAGYVFDCIIFPLTFFLIIMSMMKGLNRFLFDVELFTHRS